MPRHDDTRVARLDGANTGPRRDRAFCSTWSRGSATLTRTWRSMVKRIRSSTATAPRARAWHPFAFSRSNSRSCGACIWDLNQYPVQHVASKSKHPPGQRRSVDQSEEERPNCSVPLALSLPFRSHMFFRLLEERRRPSPGPDARWTICASKGGRNEA